MSRTKVEQLGLFDGRFVTETPPGERGLFAGQYDAIAQIIAPDWLADHLPHAVPRPQARLGWSLSAVHPMARMRRCVPSEVR